MLGKAILTTGDIARHCQVTTVTVANWIRSGKLRAYTTPGRHRRIAMPDFKDFSKKYGLPPIHDYPPAMRRILVVDDEPIVLTTITDFLSNDKNYELATATNGFEAGMEILRFRPDLVVLDLMMPYLSGFEVCRMIKSKPDTAHIKVLVMTGYASDENINRVLECGADTWLQKPFRVEEFSDKLAELLHGRKLKKARVPSV